MTTRLRHALPLAGAFIASMLLLGGCSTIGAGVPSTPGGGGDPPPAGSLRFELDGVIGVAFRDTSASASTRTAIQTGSAQRSNLVGVSATGAVADLLVDGSATISNFYIDSGRLYVVFSSPVELIQGDADTRCILAAVGANGVPECIDPSAEYIRWSNGQHDSGPPIQFDSSGTIYYVAYVNGDPVFRSFRDGITTNLLPPGVVQPQSWAVSSDGVVFATGYTNNIYWLRVIDPTASQVIRTLQQGHYATALQLFPDGNIYLWTQTNEGTGYMRIVASSDWYELEPWVGFEGSPHDVPGYSGNPPNAYYSTPAYIGVSRVFILHDPGYGKVLSEIYPQPAPVTTSVTTITHAEAAVSDVVLAGFDGTATYKLVLYNLLLAQEVDLLGGRQIEIYSLDFVPTEGFVAFDGLDFNTGEYVFGRVEIATGNLETLELTTRYTGFQAF